VLKLDLKIVAEGHISQGKIGVRIIHGCGLYVGVYSIMKLNAKRKKLFEVKS